jgi:hypothetical protein
MSGMPDRSINNVCAAVRRLLEEHRNEDVFVEFRSGVSRRQNFWDQYITAAPNNTHTILIQVNGGAVDEGGEPWQ